jgi:hypothetical protein
MQFLKRSLVRSIYGLAAACKILVILWGTLASYWLAPPLPLLRLSLAAAFMVIAVVSLFFRPSRHGLKVFTAASLLVLTFWTLRQASHEREWRPEVARLPRAVIDGDQVTLSNVRNFEYRSKTDFTPRYEDRSVDLSRLRSVDLFISHWGSEAVAHTFVSFNFDDALPVCISIEARLEQGEVYSPLASCFKQAELIYLIGDERDLVGVRTNHRDEDVYLFPVKATPEGVRKLFLSYLEKINRLADQPEFYHLLSNNCTVNIDRHAHRDGKRSPFDLRMLLNGYVGAYAYDHGLLDTSLPFEELRERSRVNRAALAAGDSADFSQRIRADLPGAAR